ncbi:MAG: hypothetical protein KH334_00135 [Clostridiales bacterium]|nr:hypothetical protein [Clostridiales bacterium]
MSLPKNKKVHGIEIKKVPVGKYIAAMREMEELPSIIIHELFPGKSMADIMADFSRADEEFAIGLMGKLLIVLPEKLLEALCSVIGISAQVAMEQLTPKELLDITREFWKINELSDFFKSVSGLIRQKLPTQNTGSSDGSPLQKASE